MRFTNAELMERKREKKRLRGLKELRGVYVDLSKVDEITAKQKVKEFIKQLENENVDITR